MLKPNYQPMEITLLKKGKTRTDLKNDLNLSTTTVAKISRGEFLNLRILAKIAEYLECGLEDLVTLEEE